MTSSNRVDASSPFLDELRSCASKGFDGSISAAANGLEVIVYLQGGNVYAVHSPQFTFPTYELAVAYTGTEPTGEDHLRWLYERINADTKGQGLGADDVDRIVRNWSYGLLAAALTWRNPKVRRNRKASVSTNKFYETAWQLVLADVTARVDDLVSSWAILTDYLASHTDFAGGARPASVACTKLVLHSPGHPLLLGEAPVDEVARTLGTTRYELLSAAARVVLSGGALSPSLMPMSPEQGAYPVPESLEDPSNEWASVEAVAEVERPAIEEPAQSDLDDAVTEPEPEPESADEYDLEEAYAALGIDVDPEPRPAPLEQPAEPDADPMPEPAAELLDVEVLDDNPLEGAVEVSVGTDIARPEDVLSGSGAAQMRTWVDASANERERALRESVYQQALVAAAETARERLAALEAKILELETTAAQAAEGREQVQAATAAAQDAREQVQAVEAELARIREQGQAYLAAEQSAQEQVDLAREQAEQAQAQVEAAQRALAAAQEALGQAEGHVAQAESDLDTVAQQARELYHQPLAQAVQVRDEVERSVLAPAQAHLDEVAAQVAGVDQAAAELVNDVMAVGYEAELGLRVVRDLDDSAAFDSDPLVASLRTLHERLTAVLDGMPELAGEPAAEPAAEAHVEHEVDEPVVEAEVVVEHEVVEEDSIGSALEDLLAEQPQQHDDVDALDAALDQVDIADDSDTEAFTEVLQAVAEGQEDQDDDFAELGDLDDLEHDDEGPAQAPAALAMQEQAETDGGDALDRLLEEVATTQVLPAAEETTPSFDAILSGEAPQSTWNGNVIQWGQVEPQA